VYNLTDEAAGLFTDDMTVDKLLIKLTHATFKHYKEEHLKELYKVRAAYDNPLLVKDILDKSIAKSNEELRKYGLETPLQLVLDV